MKYRSDVDGLRAVAVVPVLLFHGGFQTFSGGYVGVDIFFVISGYLIASLIISDLASGRFSVLHFYERRARRILPALFSVIFLVTPVAIWVMLPFQLVAFAQSIIAVNLFASNVLFWFQGGYFAGPNGEVPLLHTWSLGIEEQFYLVFPFFLLLVWRWGKYALPLGLALILFGSLFVAQWASVAHSAANFYLLPSRAWELAIGAICAVYLRNAKTCDGLLGQLGALLGMLLILAAVFLFDEKTPFPSFWTLIPVGGTALILLCSTPTSWVHRMLSLRGVVGLGLISYSTYLWHQPLLALARIRFGELGPVVSLGLLGLSVALGWLSWRYIERPFRSRNWLSGRQVFQASLAAILVSSIMAATLVYKKGFVDGYPDYQQQLVAKSPFANGRYVAQAYGSVRDKPFKSNRKKLLILGDSFSQDFYNMVRETGAFAKFEISAGYVSTRCQIYVGPENISGLRAIEDRSYCATQGVGPVLIERAKMADVIVLAANWRNWAAQRLLETIENLRATKSQKIIVIGTKGFEKFTLQELLQMTEAQQSGYRQPVAKDRRLINQIMARALPAEVFVNTLAIFCDQQSKCPLFTPQGDLISYDGAHLTRAGAKFLGTLIFGDSVLGAYQPVPGQD